MTSSGRLHHTAVVHRDSQDFLGIAMDFVHPALAVGQPVLALVCGPTRRLLEAQLAEPVRLEQVRFEDAALAGRNPARLAQTLRDLAGSHVLVEATWAGRHQAELAEELLVEALIDSALADVALHVLCAYPADSGLATLDSVHRSHRHVHHDGRDDVSPAYAADDEARRIFTQTLPEPGVPSSAYCLNGRPLADLRDFVEDLAAAARLPRARLEDLVLAVNEVATNSVQHAETDPIVRIWREDGRVICDVRDRGVIAHPAAGRLLPDPSQVSGRGLWLASQLCDLTQVRSSPEYGTIVRLHVAA